MAKKKEKMRDFLQIMSLDGSRLFGKKKLTAFKDGKLDRRLFSGVLDNSLDSMKLEEVFKKHKDEIPFPFIEEGVLLPDGLGELRGRPFSPRPCFLLHPSCQCIHRQ